MASRGTALRVFSSFSGGRHPLASAWPLSPAATLRLGLLKGAAGRGGVGGAHREVGAEAVELCYLQVSRTPRPGSTPGGLRGGGWGAPDSGFPPGSCGGGRRVGRGGGGGREAGPQDTARRTLIAPRASRVGLAHLRRRSKGRPASECWSPELRLGFPEGLGLARRRCG